MEHPSEHLVSILMNPSPSAHERLDNVLRRRAPHVVSTSVVYGEAEGLVRVTVVVRGLASEVDNLVRQIEKMIDVQEVRVLHGSECVAVQTAWLQLPDADEIRNLLLAFGGRILRVTQGELMAQLTESATEIDRFLRLAEPFGEVRSARTGVAAVPI